MDTHEAQIFADKIVEIQHQKKVITGLKTAISSFKASQATNPLRSELDDAVAKNDSLHAGLRDERASHRTTSNKLTTITSLCGLFSDSLVLDLQRLRSDDDQIATAALESLEQLALKVQQESQT